MVECEKMSGFPQRRKRMDFKARLAAAAVLCLVPGCLFCFQHPKTLLAAEQGAPVLVTRLYTGSDGLTHIDEVKVKMNSAPEFTSETGSKGITELSDPARATQAFIVRANPDFFETWHRADVRRYVVTLSGRAEIDGSDGQKAYAEPGRIFLAEDLTGKGHTVRVVSKAPWVSLFVDLDVPVKTHS
jgi:hypothetical protein